MTRATATTIDYSIPAMRIWRDLPENIHAEVINRKLYILPQPTTYHQDVLGDLFVELAVHGKSTGIGKSYVCNTGVILKNGQSVVEPDVIFIKKDNSNCVVDKKGLFGPPDLLIEIASSNKKHDSVRKHNLYEQAGVKEYWIVDPETKDSFGYLLENGKYDEPLTLNSKINIRVLDK